MKHKERCNPLLLGCLLLLLVVSFRAFALDPASSISQYNCQTWTRHNGLPVNSVYAITQTKDGYLWLGTSLGLLRFDGVGFTLIGAPPVPEIRNSKAACLAPAQDGGLWFGLEKSAYGFYDGRGGWLVGKDPNGDMDWDVPSLLESRDRTLWIGGRYCSRIAAGTTNLQLLFQGEANPPFVSTVFEDSKGRVWLGTIGPGLYYWQNGVINKFPDPALDTRIIRALAEDERGRLWVGTHVGLRCYDSNFRSVDVAFPFYEVLCLLVDRHGVLWVGTSNEGLFRCKDGVFDSLRKTDGLAGDAILALAEDREGSLWVGTRDGLSQITDVKFPTYLSQEGVFSTSVHSVSASPRGGLWVSTGVGVMYFDGGRTRLYGTNAGLADRYVKRAFEARNGDVYVLSGRYDIEVMSGGRVVARHATPNMPVALAEDSKGVVVSIAGDLYRVSRTSLVPYEFSNGRKPDLYWVINLATGRDDSIWVASVNGVCRVKDGNFQQWTANEGLADSSARWVCEEPDGTVWVGMATGIARLRDGKIHNLRRKDGLPDPCIYAIMPDEHGNLWVYTARGLFQLKKQNVDDFFHGKTDHVECTAYEGAEGNEWEASACRTLDGRIWFPGAKGVIAVDPANIPVNRIVPPVRVHRVRASGIELDRSKPLVLKPGKQELEFAYTALSFVSPEKVRFRYKLDGLDADWIEAGDRRMAYYANLHPGRYTFHVTACNADGIWNEIGDSVQVELLPQFYQTVWFQALCGVVVVGVVFGGYGWRLRHLTRKQRALQESRILLEAKIAERTGELAGANTSLRDEIQQRSRVQAELEAEIEERKRMQIEVGRVHRQLVDASRQAGQAEVASSVLHNVGNVLNSVNVSTAIIADRVRNMRLGNLTKAADLLKEHEGDLSQFLTQNQRGQQLPAYLEQLARHLGREQDELLTELKDLAQNVDHIKEIVAMQQSYARVAGVVELVTPVELVEGALKMHSTALSRHGVAIERQFEEVPAVMVDRHKVMQILVNLLHNAKYACDEGNQTDKKVEVRIKHAGDKVAIEVADNGIGIAPENMTRIFGHGFTTRSNGHGFGLHSAALSAKEIGGALTAHSRGLGYGATFTLELPLQPSRNFADKDVAEVQI